MAFRRATLDDVPTLVELIQADDPDPPAAWALAPADDPSDAWRRLTRWDVEVSVRTGAVLFDEHGVVLAATPVPPLPEVDSSEPPALVTAESAPRMSGIWFYPALPVACLERLHRYACAITLATPPRPVVVVRPLRPGLSPAAWAAAEQEAAALHRPLWAHADSRSSAALAERGFTRVVEVPVEGADLVVEGWAPPGVTAPR